MEWGVPESIGRPKTYQDLLDAYGAAHEEGAFYGHGPKNLGARTLRLVDRFLLEREITDVDWRFFRLPRIRPQTAGNRRVQQSGEIVTFDGIERYGYVLGVSTHSPELYFGREMDLNTGKIVLPEGEEVPHIPTTRIKSYRGDSFE